jgi:hypothetical protein
MRLRAMVNERRRDEFIKHASAPQAEAKFNFANLQIPEK